MIYVEKKRTKFLALPICFTTYTINDDKINIKSGFLSTTEDDAFMYKIQDVRLYKSLLERIFGLGTLVCFTGDTTHPELKLLHIKNSGEIKEFLMQASEEARRKRRTLHTLDVDDPDVNDLNELDEMN
jgi:uncharacterized membrane protein YdbT with pleckstrin-like domain